MVNIKGNSVIRKLYIVPEEKRYTEINSDDSVLLVSFSNSRIQGDSIVLKLKYKKSVIMASIIVADNIKYFRILL